MAAAVTCDPASPHAVDDACMIAVTGGQTDRDPDGTGGQMIQYLEASLAGEKSLVSERFVPSKDGHWLWQGVYFPVDGTWTVALKDDNDDSTIASASVVVQATA